MALQISLDIQQSAFEHDVIEGLSRPKGNRSIPSRYLYDERGCELFEEICGTPEYYPTRTEIAIMRENAHQMADLCGPRCRLVELGSGASIKTEMLLDQLQDPLVYVPVDIAPEYLRPAVEKLKRRYPDLEIEPVCADFSEPFELLNGDDVGATVVYFPGSTIGNFTPESAVELLANMNRLVRPNGGVLIGMDLKKDVPLLESAYNDEEGITADFTHNLLTRMMRELDADLVPDQFEHLARYNRSLGRIEIYLRSLVRQHIQVGETQFELDADELINTEYSYKYDLAQVQDMAVRAQMAMTHAWLDPLNWFGIFFFGCRP